MFLKAPGFNTLTAHVICRSMIRLETKTRRVIAGLAVLLLHGLLSPTAGADEAPGHDPTGERTAFIEQRLDEGRKAAWRWQTGWTSVYAGVAVVQGTMAITDGDHDERVVNGVGALRAIAALTLIRMRPDPGRHGADPVRSAGPEGSRERLEAAVALLRASAHHADRRYSIRRHALNVGLNAFFGGLVWAFGDSDDAITSTLLGIAGGEAALLSRSRQPIRNLQDYRSRFPDRVEWALVPRAGGIGFEVRF